MRWNKNFKFSKYLITQSHYMCVRFKSSKSLSPIRQVFPTLKKRKKKKRKEFDVLLFKFVSINKPKTIFRSLLFSTKFNTFYFLFKAYFKYILQKKKKMYSWHVFWVADNHIRCATNKFLSATLRDVILKW